MLNWKDSLAVEFDLTYAAVKNEIYDISYPCYGGRFNYFLITRRFEKLYLYLTEDELIYAVSGGADITRIAFKDITKLSVNRGLLSERIIHIRFIAGKKYHLFINDIKDFSTDLTGNGAYNAVSFIDTFRRKTGLAGTKDKNGK